MNLSEAWIKLVKKIHFPVWKKVGFSCSEIKNIYIIYFTAQGDIFLKHRKSGKQDFTEN